MKMSASLVSKILLAIAIIILIGTAYSMNRDYQDSWTLQGLEIPFAFFVLTFVFVFYFEKGVLRRVTLAVLGRTVYMLIPTVKYVWFTGPFVDQNVQQAMANYVVTNGHIMTSPTVSQPYSLSPLIHLSLAMFSIVLDAPVESTMKYLPIFLSMLFPLLIYIIVKNMFPAESTLIGYVVFISAIPISEVQYVVSGSLFGILFVQFILAILVLIYVKKNRYFWPILLLSVIALAATHSVSSILFTVFLLVLIFLKRFSRLGLSSFLSTKKVLILISIGFAWFMFQANNTLQTIVEIFTVGIPTGSNPVSQRIGTGSFSLLQVDPIAAATSFFVIYGADVFFLFLTFIGLLFMLRLRKKLTPISKFFGILCSIILLLGVLGGVISAGGPRLLYVAELLFPIFSGVFVFNLLKKKTRVRKLIVGAVFFMILFSATIEFYGCQTLVPSANVLYKDLPSGVPLNNLGQVNSIYQRQMIIFSAKYIPEKVAAVFPIINQIIGLTDTNFSLKVVTYDPLDSNLKKPYYNFLLINVPGPAGDFAGNPDLSLNIPGLVSNYISNQTIIYTNGESYVIVNTP